MNDANRSSVGHYRWVICALLFFATTINYVDRAVLGVLEPSWKRIWLDRHAIWQHQRVRSRFAYAIGFLLCRLDDGQARHAARLCDCQ